eukprot:1158480-Pelagomonas_calceolata.AAC.10
MNVLALIVWMSCMGAVHLWPCFAAMRHGHAGAQAEQVLILLELLAALAGVLRRTLWVFLTFYALLIHCCTGCIVALCRHVDKDPGRPSSPFLFCSLWHDRHVDEDPLKRWVAHPDPQRSKQTPQLLLPVKRSLHSQWVGIEQKKVPQHSGYLDNKGILAQSWRWALAMLDYRCGEVGPQGISWDEVSGWNFFIPTNCHPKASLCKLEYSVPASSLYVSTLACIPIFHLNRYA